MRRTGILAVFAFLLVADTAEARKRYDERGNPLSEGAALGQQTSGVTSLPATDHPVASAGLAEKSAADAASSAAEPASTAEEETAQQQVRNPLTKVYLENAQLYLRSNRIDKALEFLRRSQEAGEDNYSREARLQSYWLRARRGDTGLAAEAESLDEAIRLVASLRVADGYYACARELKQKAECLAEAERLYAYIAELAPASQEGRLAAFRLGQLLLDQGRLEAALPQLTRLLADEPKTPARKYEVPFDRAWFALGSLYERPWYHRDTHKARLAYQQVLKYPDSPYRSQAKERIRYLERFGTGYPGTGTP